MPSFARRRQPPLRLGAHLGHVDLHLRALVVLERHRERAFGDHLERADFGCDASLHASAITEPVPAVPDLLVLDLDALVSPSRSG